MNKNNFPPHIQILTEVQFDGITEEEGLKYLDKCIKNVESAINVTNYQLVAWIYYKYKSNKDVALKFDILINRMAEVYENQHKLITKIFGSSNGQMSKYL